MLKGDVSRGRSGRSQSPAALGLPGTRYAKGLRREKATPMENASDRGHVEFNRIKISRAFA